MSNIVGRLVSSIRFRAKRWRLGLDRTCPDPKASLYVRVGRTDVGLRFPPGEQEVLIHEFGRIVFEDCYGLELLPKNDIHKIIDVGANVGLFSLAARLRFPSAVIHSYEPNAGILPLLRHNVDRLNVRVVPNAVGRHAGRVQMSLHEGSLFSTTTAAVDGGVEQTAIAAAIDDARGAVDLLKLDCEGAEWEILQDSQAMARVRRIAMEYHPAHGIGGTIESLIERLGELGFVITRHHPSKLGPHGMLCAAAAT